MKKLLYPLLIMLFVSPVLAVDSQTVIMNTKPIFTIALTVSGQNAAPKTVSKPPNKKPKLKEQGLVKSVVDRVTNRMESKHFV